MGSSLRTGYKSLASLCAMLGTATLATCVLAGVEKNKNEVNQKQRQEYTDVQYICGFAGLTYLAVGTIFLFGAIKKRDDSNNSFSDNNRFTSET